MQNTPSNQICQCQCGALHGTFMVLSQGLNNCGVTNKSNKLECHSNQTDGTRLPIDTWPVSWMVVSLNGVSNCKTCRTCKTTSVIMEIRMCRTLHTDSCKVFMGCLMSCKWNLSNQSLKGFPMDGALVSILFRGDLFLWNCPIFGYHTVNTYTSTGPLWSVDVLAVTTFCTVQPCSQHVLFAVIN
jgi:hypothetical protein